MKKSIYLMFIWIWVWIILLHLTKFTGWALCFWLCNDIFWIGYNIQKYKQY